MAEALGDVSKSQVDRLYRLGMPRHSADAARAWRLAHLELSRTVESRIDRPQAPAPDGSKVAVATDGTARSSAASHVPEDAAPDDDDTKADEHTETYRAERAANERLKRERAELELAQLRGDLVAVREVRELEYTAGRITRDRVLMVPARVAADLHAQALQAVPEEQREAVAKAMSMHALERRLEEELRAALVEAAKAIEEARTDDDDADA